MIRLTFSTVSEARKLCVQLTVWNSLSFVLRDKHVYLDCVWNLDLLPDDTVAVLIALEGGDVGGVFRSLLDLPPTHTFEFKARLAAKFRARMMRDYQLKIDIVDGICCCCDSSMQRTISPVIPIPHRPAACSSPDTPASIGTVFK